MKNPNEMSFLGHLEELRWHLIRSCVSIFLCGTIAFFFKDFIFDTLIFGPKKIDFVTYRFFCDLSKNIWDSEIFCISELPFRIQSRTVAGQFSAHLWTSVLAGFIIAFPYVVYEFWKFVSPGLHQNEKKNAKWFIFLSSILFFTGIVFGYYVVTPLSVNFLGSYSVSNEIFNDFDLSSYIGLVRASVLASGIIFELPIIIYFLTKIGVVTPVFLKKNRKFALVIVLSIAAIITPPDVISQIIVSIPILLLYEISIFISKATVKKTNK